MKKSDTVRYTAEQLAGKRRQGQSRSNWRKAASVSRNALERSIAVDPDEGGMIVDWDKASVEMPEPKSILNMRVDKDVLEFFRRSGRGYQTRINAVLKAYVRAQEKPPKSARTK